MNEDAARFYLNFHCRLTEHPVSLQVVWPLFVEGNYIVKHNQNSTYVLVEGNVEKIKTFPSVNVCQLNNSDSKIKLYEILCSGRQQLISVGRTKVLQYTYFWREPLDYVGLYPKILVKDVNDSEFAPGETDVLPPKKILCFKSTFDGELIIYNNNCVVDKQKIYADKNIELDGLCYGLSVQVVIGLDVIWEVEFKKTQPIVENDEVEILKQITNVSGIPIETPHPLKNILVGMNCYPQICQWIRKCIKKGVINEQSYRRLQNIYRSINTNR